MAESVTITRTPPDFKSMRFDLLREEGLKHIQQLAGKLWTDYNLSDPGVSILEVLSYVITDLGYRSSYSIPDILAQDPSLPSVNIRNFYTAREILPMYPVTLNDYRELLIDCDVHDPSDIGCPIVGVKNAWIECSDENEIPIYIKRGPDKLDYEPEIPSSPEKLNLKVLYNILLELDKCEKYGDLNENTLESTITISAPTTPLFLKPFSGMKVKVEIEFPRWDDPGVDWNDPASIQSHVKGVTLVFTSIPQGFKLDDYGLFPDKTVWVSISQLPIAGAVPVAFIESPINALIYDITNPNSLINLYQLKVKKILQIIAEVRARLMANRNLCEDVFKIRALKTEEIAVCADIDLETDADVEEVQAKIYFEIAKFLAPTVYFYTLEEMYEKGKRTEEIFEGPPLRHGFIDVDELAKADRRKVIHVSDLINIIMDVPGVIAVKSIQIGNVPLDNDDNIPSLSVRWCLDLAFEFNYVPRLSTELSKITFFKDLLPFKANDVEVDELIKEMEEAARPQKIENPILDLPVPQGEFKNIEEYVSTQDEFPLVYGIGPEGLADSSTDLRKAQAKQLKGFLMFFDQLLADYLSQLAHVKDLFSMNGERDAFGNFIIDKSYFTQSLIPSVTDANSLLVNPVLYPKHVQDITENEELFEKRRNEFLDHLMARFSEQFTDYAMVVYKLTGKKAPKELLIDKLEVLNAYPEISSGRFKAFDYESPCELWDVENESGLERRVELLNGVPPRTSSDLNYNSNFIVNGSLPNLTFEIINPSNLQMVLVSPPLTVYETLDKWKLAIEKVLINGVNRERYTIYDGTGNPITPENPITYFNGPFTFDLRCDKGNLLAVNPTDPINPFPPYGPYPAFSPLQPGKNVEKALGSAIFILSNEFYFNTESNRNNLSCPISNYIVATAPVANMVPNPPTYTYNFTLYKVPFDFVPANELMTGTYTSCGEPKAEETIIGVNTGTNEAYLSGDFTGKIKINDPITINNSGDNDGNYTVTAIQIVVIGSNTETHLTLTGGPPLQNTIPYGTLFYNTQTQAQLEAFAAANQEEVLFQIMLNGTLKNHYTFDALTLQYRFNIANKCKDTLATSVEYNFNSIIAATAANHPAQSLLIPPLNPNEIRLVDNDPANDGTYTVTSTTTDNSGNIVVRVPPPQLLPFAGGNLLFDGTYAVTSVNRPARTFTLNGVLNRMLFPEESIKIINSSFNDGDYTIETVTTDGLTTDVRVKEKIFDDVNVLGDLYYLKTLPVMNIVQLGGLLGSDIYAKAGADDVAVDEMVQFISSKFFGHEGMHVVEHILLRPKVNEDLFLPITKSLTPALTPQGSLEFTKVFPVASASTSTNMFFISGDITLDLAPLMYITIKDSTANINDNTYRVVTFGFTGTVTGIKVFEPIPDQTLPNNGDIYFQKTVPITSAGPGNTVTINEDINEIDDSSQAIIKNSQDKINDGTYRILPPLTPGSGTQVIFTFDEVLTRVQDRLLTINLKDECENCVIEDPYSFIASVVLPYWQGRFLNQDFRKFFERSLRLECPAHVALNICWIDCGQMKEFELKYKTWLVENCKKDKNKVALSTSLNELIDILERLRSVYPPGTLHDCEDENSLQNSIILNRSALGTIQI
jgi:hypothetical protein